jgi:hypothetical protein
MARSQRLWAVVAALSLALAVQALAENKAPVRIYHPASLGEALVGKRVLIGPVSGDCGEEFARLLTRDLHRHGISVFDRAGVAAVLYEHDLTMASLAEADAAAELTRFIGPALMFSVEVPRCDARERDTSIQGGMPAPYKSHAEGRFIAVIHVVDLTKGRELAANTIHVDLQREADSVNGVLERRGPRDARDIAIERAAALAQRMYVPWTETWEVPFKDDNNCGLRQAWDLVRNGDYDGVVRLSRVSASSCGDGDSRSSDAWYDLGVAYMLVQDYDDALSALDKAQKLHGSRMVKEAIAGCRRIRTFAENMAPLWEEAAFEPQQREETPADILLTNGFIIGLVHGNVAEDDIVQMIAARPGRFSLAPEDVVTLRNASVPASVISAMRAKGK